jgi:bla regulator protein BlaR1
MRSLEQLCDVIARIGWTQFWQVSVLALLVGLVAKTVCRRWPHLAYLLWMLVIVKALLPPIMASPVGVFSVLSQRLAGAAPLAARQVQSPKLQRLATSPDQAHASESRQAQAAPRGTERQTHSLPAVNWWNLLRIGVVLVWLGGVVGLAVYLVRAHLRLTARLRREGGDAGPEWQHILQDLSGRLGVRRRPQLIVAANPIGPAVIGCWRPVLVVPEALLAQERAAVEPILAHELAHLRRGDPWGAVLQTIAQVVWWFHPLVWWANREAAHERERACDEEALARLGCSPTRYAHTLVDILESRIEARQVATWPGIDPSVITARRLRHLIGAATFHVCGK